MSANDLLDLLNELLFTTLAVLALIDFLRHRDAMRRDVALLFGLLSMPFVVLLIAHITGTDWAMWLGQLAIAALAIEPYALMRIVRYLREIPPTVMKLTRYGAIACVAAILIVGFDLPPLPTLAVQLYFVVVNLYAMVSFVRGMRNSAGVMRRRLRFATIGSGLLGLIILAGILSNAIPVLSLAGPVLTLICALAFYVAFAPPRWLRRMWQLSETNDFLIQIGSKPLNERLHIDELMTDLCKAANRAVSGMASGIVRKHVTSQEWVLAHTDRLTEIPMTSQGVLGRAWAYSAPASVSMSDPLNHSDHQLFEAVGASTLLVTPILTNSEGVWGLLLVFLQHGSLFVEDDLHFLALLARQNAMLLENSTLVERLLSLNTELERRASQLTAANKELEAFSYSVSHDLRAPLRAVDGFSQVLQEDHAEQLDEDGRKYLTRIRAASQRMGQLIDDLLALSQFSRSQMRRTDVDLSEIAHKIAAELHEQNPGREVECQIQDGLVVNGDLALLRVAMSNLLGNAWKYTGKQPKAQITFGCIEKDGRPAYFVRDNGAGFDMEYADKLFGVFQRLHSANEFPGNGIGLATVQRIIHRHGGEIWAESAVDQGAAFYFSL